MTESQNNLWFGGALIVIGVGLILFGGSSETGRFVELFGFRFGQGESEPMSMGQRLFWGIACIAGGEVISVETGSNEGTPRAGRALVKLLSGERVQALVPVGCGVLPGQTTRVAKRAIGSDTSYVVVENGK